MIQVKWTYEQHKILDTFNSKELYFLNLCIENNYYWKTMLQDIRNYVRQNKTKENKNEQTSKYATVY